MSNFLFAALFLVLEVTRAQGNWYDGIESIKVFGPSDDVGSYAYNLWTTNKTQIDQFGTQRHALLLRRGTYGASSEIVGTVSPFFFFKCCITLI